MTYDFSNFPKHSYSLQYQFVNPTDSEADLLQKSPFFYFRLAEKVTQICTAKLNGIFINISFENLQVDSDKR